MTATHEDPFLTLFFSRIPKELVSTFTPAQLDAVKRAFGARSAGAHAVDLRMSFPLLRNRGYLVVLAGRERRGAERLAFERLLRPIWSAANVLLAGCIMLGAVVALAALLYMGKRALNIDVFPGIDMLPDRTIERLLR